MPTCDEAIDNAQVRNGKVKAVVNGKDCHILDEKALRGQISSYSEQQNDKNVEHYF